MRCAKLALLARRAVCGARAGATARPPAENSHPAAAGQRGEWHHRSELCRSRRKLLPIPNVPQGDVREFIMYSEDSPIYPGIVRVEARTCQRDDAMAIDCSRPADLSAPGRYERHVYVYIPRQYVPAHRALHGGAGWPFLCEAHGQHPGQHDRRQTFAAMVVVFAEFRGQRRAGLRAWLGIRHLSRTAIPTGWSRNCCRRCHEEYRRDLHVRPGRPRRHGRFTRAAVAAFTMAWFHPERYHKVLSYSGTFVNQAWPPGSQDAARGLGISRSL